MAHQDKGLPCTVEIQDHAVQLVFDIRVHAGKGLIQDTEDRVKHEHAGKLQQFLLSARELLAEVVLKRIEPHIVQELQAFPLQGAQIGRPMDRWGHQILDQVGFPEQPGDLKGAGHP